MDLEHPAALAGPPIDWAALRRILVVRPDNLGDVVLSGPALRALRRAAPRARLDLLAAPAGAAVAPLLPEVGEVLVASVSWQQLDPAAVPAEEDLALLDRIRAGRYDAAVLLTSFTQSPWPAAQLCRLAGVPVRVGTSKEFGGAGLTHWVPSPPDELHQVDRALRVLARVGVPPVDGRLRLAVPDTARATAGEVLAKHGVTGPYAVLLPGASCSSRRYPVDRFAEVAGLLAAAGELDVPALAAALAGARVVVCNNSGGAHLADAVGVPVVVLFAGTEQPDQFRPRAVPAAVLTVPTPCAPCRQLRCPYGLECLDLAPERVAREALRLAGQGVPSGAGARDRIRSMMADVDRSGT